MAIRKNESKTSLELQLDKGGEPKATDKNAGNLREYRCHDIY